MWHPIIDLVMYEEYKKESKGGFAVIGVVKAVVNIKNVLTKGALYPLIDSRMGYVEVEEEYLVVDDKGNLIWVDECWEVVGVN